jgi:hypothetical protein
MSVTEFNVKGKDDGSGREIKIGRKYPGWEINTGEKKREERYKIYAVRMETEYRSEEGRRGRRISYRDSVALLTGICKLKLIFKL